MRLHDDDDDDDDSGLFGNLGLYIFVRGFRMAYKRGGGGRERERESLYPRGLKSASKQAIVVLFKKRFAFTGFTQGRTINRQFLQGKITKGKNKYK